MISSRRACAFFSLSRPAGEGRGEGVSPSQSELRSLRAAPATLTLALSRRAGEGTKARFIACVCVLSVLLSCLAPAEAPAARITPKDSSVLVTPETLATVHTDPLYLELRQMESTIPRTQFFTHIAVRIEAARDWRTLRTLGALLWENSYGMKDTPQLDINYYLLYSDVYARLPVFLTNPRTQGVSYLVALKALMLFETLAMADSVRCTDPTGWKEFKQAILVPRINPLKQAYPFMKLEAFTETVAGLFATEEQLLTRPANEALCNMGTRPKSADTPLLVETYAWYNKRQTVKKVLTKFFTERYSDAIGEKAGEKAAEPEKQ